MLLLSNTDAGWMMTAYYKLSEAGVPVGPRESTVVGVSTTTPCSVWMLQ